MIVKFKKPKTSKISKISKLPLHNPKIFYPLLAALIVACALFLDKPFALFFSSFQSDWKDLLVLVNSIMNPYLSLLLFPTLFFFVRFVQRKERKSRKLWYLSFATALPLFLTSFLQVLFGRSNPDWFFTHKEIIFRFFEWNSSFHSFPSSTACNIAGIGSALAYVYPKYSARFFLGGTLLGLVPAVLNACFLSDSLAGICCGVLLSMFIYKTMRKELSFS